MTPTESLLVPDMPREEYDRLDRVNWTRLKPMARSPKHYLHAQGEKRKDTPSLAMGRAVHTAVLEPDLFPLQYAVWLTGRRAGAAWDNFCAVNVGREILSRDEYDRCIAIKNAVHGSDVARQYVTGGRAEVTALWTHRTETIGGLPGFQFSCKGRLDYARADVLVDLKTTRDASPDGFGREAWKYRYCTQAAFYRDGYAAATGRALSFVLVAVETEPPHVVQVYRVPDDLLDHGREDYRALLAQLYHCRTHDEWGGYAEAELDLSLPRWSGVGTNDDEDFAGLDLAI